MENKWNGGLFKKEGKSLSGRWDWVGKGWQGPKRGSCGGRLSITRRWCSMGWNWAKPGSKSQEGRTGSGQRCPGQLLRATGGSSQPCFFFHACARVLESQAYGQGKGAWSSSAWGWDVFSEMRWLLHPFIPWAAVEWQTPVLPILGLACLSCGPAQGHVGDGIGLEPGLHAVSSSLQCLCCVWWLVSCQWWSVGSPRSHCQLRFLNSITREWAG